MILSAAMRKHQAQHRFAYFITAHGFGHASRACAVMQSILEKDSTIRFEVFTQTPEWFFKNSLSADIGYHHLETDIGMVQTSPFKDDINATLNRLRRLLPFDLELLAATGDVVKQLRCEMVLCDIAPMGIAVADAADLPSVLVENFTWDWIYTDYQSASNQFQPYIDYLKTHFRGATYHIKTEPFCQPGNPDLIVAPVSRKPRNQATAVRARLGVGKTEKMVVLTMGGISDRKDYTAGLERFSGIHFVIPGVDYKLRRRANLTLLPSRSDFFHPDLIHAADAVIGKAGYSTIAEVYQAGKPFGYVAKPAFRESSVLIPFIQDRLAGVPISREELYNSTWVKKIPRLLSMPVDRRERENGADEIAEFVLARL